MNEVSPKQGMLLAPGWMRQDASQIVPPRSSDPMTEGPLCRIRREARARGAVAALVSENLNGVDFNRPNREARARGAVAALVSENLNGVTSTGRIERLGYSTPCASDARPRASRLPLQRCSWRA